MKVKKILSFFLSLTALMSLCSCEAETDKATESQVYSQAISSVTRSGSPSGSQETGEGAEESAEDAEQSAYEEAEAVAEEEELGESTEAVLKFSGSLYSSASADDPIIYLSAGDELTVYSTDNVLWFYTELSDGTAGYIYGELLYSADDDGESLAQKAVNEKISELELKLVEGRYWNHVGFDEINYGDETPWITTKTPCNHDLNGEAYCNFYNGAFAAVFSYGTLDQCLGFASLLSDQIFTEDAPIYEYYDLSLLRVGDHIRLYEYEHSMTVIEINDYGITVGECNENYKNCAISWSRTLTWSELYDLRWDMTLYSRYPLCKDGDSYVSWESLSGTETYSYSAG